MHFLPPSVLDELSSLSPDVASNLDALGFDLVGLWTALGTPGGSKLHHTMVQQKLLPKLGDISSIVEEEVVIAVKRNLAVGKEWTEIKPYQMLLSIVAQVSSRIRSLLLLPTK